MSDDNWPSFPDEWPEVETEQEYLALTMLLASFNEVVAVLDKESELRRAVSQSADGLRLQIRTWERNHGIEPPPPLG